MEEKLSDSSLILGRLEETRVGSRVAPDPPKVSVIIPAYNVSGFITESLDSVFEQTFEDFETIVVNDGSADTEHLEKVLSDYYDRVVYARQENSGASKARNAAICLSRGDLIAFLDGDDQWLPGYLKHQVAFLENKNLDMVYCDAQLFGEGIHHNRTYMKMSPSDGEVNPVSLISARCNVITSGTLVRRSSLEESSLFDSGARRAQDFDLWFRLAKLGTKIGYQKDVLLKYRVSSESLSGTNVQRAERNISILKFINEKYDLTEGESAAWKHQLEFSEAEAELEKGKLSLVEGNYNEARQQISKANEYYRKPKLYLLQLLLSVSPKLTLTLFRRFRPDEFSFISPGDE